MSDYAFVHEGKAYTPNGTTSIADPEAHNRAIEQAELRAWAEAPDRFVAYYSIPTSADGSTIYYGRGAREQLGKDAYVSTWLGTRLGDITYATRYRHNFGHRFVSIAMRGTNGATYYGRASWDGGNVIRLRKAKGGK